MGKDCHSSLFCLFWSPGVSGNGANGAPGLQYKPYKVLQPEAKFPFSR